MGRDAVKECHRAANSMAYRGFLMYLMFLGVWTCGTLGRGVNNPGTFVSILNSSHDEIPQRCIEKTVSELPCLHVSEDRLLAHPDDCQLFYYCVGDAAVCRQCPADLHFSPTKHVCERPARAGCVRAPQHQHDDE